MLKLLLSFWTCCVSTINPSLYVRSLIRLQKKNRIKIWMGWKFRRKNNCLLVSPFGLYIIWNEFTWPVATITGSLISSKDIGQRKSSGITIASGFLTSGRFSLPEISRLLGAALIDKETSEEAWILLVLSNRDPAPKGLQLFPSLLLGMLPSSDRFSGQLCCLCNPLTDLPRTWLISWARGWDESKDGILEIINPYLSVARLNCVLTKST